MGNANSSSKARQIPSDQPIDSQELQAALEQAAKMRPDLYAPSYKPGHHPHAQRGGKVAYFLETEGNEPMDATFNQQPLEEGDLPNQVGGELLPHHHPYDASRRRRRMSGASGRRRSSRSLRDTSDQSMEGSHRRRSRGNYEQFYQDMAHKTPQQVLRELELLADAGVDDTHEYLHYLKDMSTSSANGVGSSRRRAV